MFVWLFRDDEINCVASDKVGNAVFCGGSNSPVRAWRMSGMRLGGDEGILQRLPDQKLCAQGEKSGG